MNKYMLHIVVSVVCIVGPVLGLLYGLWDSNQPKVGPVGDGKPIYPTLPQWISIVAPIIAGLINLPFAIIRYRQNKKD
ncbi:hypothetical protein [Paenibacillus tundrae]|uniref:Uncharacterized protein n=1 Tax=Paenibacillus tundrae TaxID=528187 RepID=A0ABT9W8X1_9BACL|nr:hypothetical protein [Paenibacillus tundrae]MDQ0169305.1 hypothetical protein [Paenibacillus tundrae]